MKNRLITSISALLAFLLMVSMNEPTGKIEINISGLTSSKGKVIIGLYNEEEGFSEYDKSFKNGVVSAKISQVNYTFDNIKEGEYAIALWHDENGNNELDKNFLGIPKEKYGFSNNKYGKIGPPDFHEVKFSIKAGKTTSLKINLK